MSAPIRGCVFDAYGTLFEVAAVGEAARAVTDDPAALASPWRQKQREQLGLAVPAPRVRAPMEAYLEPACVPEVIPPSPSSVGRTRGTWPARKPSATGWPGATAPGRRPRSSGWRPTSW